MSEHYVDGMNQPTCETYRDRMFHVKHFSYSTPAFDGFVGGNISGPSLNPATGWGST